MELASHLSTMANRCDDDWQARRQLEWALDPVTEPIEQLVPRLAESCRVAGFHSRKYRDLAEVLDRSRPWPAATGT
jgi:hypothetical protein